MNKLNVVFIIFIINLISACASNSNDLNEGNISNLVNKASLYKSNYSKRKVASTPKKVIEVVRPIYKIDKVRSLNNTIIREDKVILFYESVVNSSNFIPSPKLSKKILSLLTQSREVEISANINEKITSNMALERAKNVFEWFNSKQIDTTNFSIKNKKDNKNGVDIYFYGIAKEKSLKTINVSLIDSLLKVANTLKLRFVDNGLADERLDIVSNDDSMNILNQLSEKSKYAIKINNELALLLLVKDKNIMGEIEVFGRDNQLVILGEPIYFSNAIKKPMLLHKALRIIAPKDFTIGFESGITRDVYVDIKNLNNWREALQIITRQVPYRIVWDWNNKNINVLSLLKK